MTSHEKRRLQEKQSADFVAAAQALECDESEARFNEALGKVVRHKPPTEKTKSEKEKAAK